MVSFLRASLLLAASLLLLTPTATAQENEKQDLKAWKKKAKEYVKNPEQLKRDTESFQRQLASLRSELEMANARAEQLTTEAQTCESEKKQLTADVRKLKEQNNSQTQALEAAKNQLQQQANMLASRPVELPDNEGVLFRVQIAAFAQDTLGLPDGKPSLLERDQDMSKYVLASFREYLPAKEFRDKLRRLGLRDAWIVAYRDGVRVPTESVLQSPAADPAAGKTTVSRSYEPDEIHE